MSWRILQGDVREVLATLPDQSVQCCVTSPPYWGLRDYGTATWDGGDAECDHASMRREGGQADSFATSKQATSAGSSRDPIRSDCRKCGARRIDSQIGLEPTPDAFVASLVQVFREVRRVLRDDGVLWLNLGDSYATQPGKNNANLMEWAAENAKGGGRRAGLQDTPLRSVPSGLKPKDLVGIPWRVAFALQADGWYLRSDIIWSKPNPMPESVTDRPTKAHEYVFLLTKSERYFYDAAAIRQPFAPSTLVDFGEPYESAGTKDYAAAGVQNPSAIKKRIKDKQRGHGRRHAGFNDRWDGMAKDEQVMVGANCRSVWEIATQPFSEWGETSRQVRVSWDESDGDTTRTTSPDCPVHGDRAVQSAKAVCGGRAADGQTGSARTDGDHALEPVVGSVPIGSRREQDSAQRSSDSHGLSCSEPAKRRNSRTSRTDLAPVTTQPCMPSAQNLDGIGDTSGARESFGSAERTTASSNEADCVSSETVTVDGETLRRIEGKCSCAYYRTVTEKVSHFATFPEALPERCIKAGSKPGDTVMDPFCGAGTTGLVADRLGRDFIGIELNPAYLELARKRIGSVTPLFPNEVSA